MAEPSRATWNSMDEDQPRVCHGCGEKVRMTKEDLWLDTFHKLTWHAACRTLAQASAQRTFERLWQDEAPQDRLVIE